MHFHAGRKALGCKGAEAGSRKEQSSHGQSGGGVAATAGGQQRPQAQAALTCPDMSDQLQGVLELKNAAKPCLATKPERGEGFAAPGSVEKIIQYSAGAP